MKEILEQCACDGCARCRFSTNNAGACSRSTGPGAELCSRCAVAHRRADRREHLVRLLSIAAMCIAAGAFLATDAGGRETRTLVEGALLVLVPALLDSVRHWRRATR